MAIKIEKSAKQDAPKQNKVPIYIRLDKDVADAYRAIGKGWQTRMNEDLRKTMPKGRS